ncbi:EAL domain-containing protein [Companilactobacillus kimchiensis]|uniref:Diguanylate cyclase phosphodiesterase domain-containing protein n=1 Tax=Companilactobacillus kimchiensis TaxID=993692 RepID=A0A0R2LL72_9LACO|nr:EAL domain-containing protein [Companilactobacillus kimchiensis]KRO00096.1 diguanylate cyclase phosphodiesterase domain-containing protein [Companilactobacillus kimchiensis]
MEPVYRYFVQPQFDIRTHTVFGYELLIKQLTSEGWRLPKSFSSIDSNVMSKLLMETTKILGLKVQYCSVNVSREQLMDTMIAKAIIQSQIQLYPAKLVVELTEEDGPRSYPDTGLIPHLRNFVEHGMQISLDDVGTGINDFKSIQEILPLASEVKFALQNFKTGIENPIIQQKLHFWHAISREYGLRLILEGIEDARDSKLSSSFGINLRQGYYYGKPQLLRLPGDPVDFGY